jgi:hypothetical protein
VPSATTIHFVFFPRLVFPKSSPLFCVSKAPSIRGSSQLIRPCSLSSSIIVCHISRNTPASSHFTNLLGHVLREGNLSGKSFQRTALLSNHPMPSKQLRSSVLGQPPLGCSTFKIKRLTFSHCSSVSKASRHPNIVRLFRCQVYPNVTINKRSAI